MADDDCKPVAVSRRIDAPARDIFKLLADPGRHPDIDGSGMLREGSTYAVISGVGDVFVMQMYYPALGDYEMNNHVVEYELNRRIGWEPIPGRGHPAAASPMSIAANSGQRWIFELTPDGPYATIVTEIYDCCRAPEETRVSTDHGNQWLESMTETLQRLDGLCAKKPGGPEGAPTPS